MAPIVLEFDAMPDRVDAGDRPALDAATFDLGRKAAYRRVLGLLKSKDQPFVVGGSLGLSVHAGQLFDGPLEILVPAPAADGALAALEGAGFRITREDVHFRATVSYGEHHVFLSWALPPPLGGVLDDVWFTHAVRSRFLDLRIRVAPVEELLWLRVAVAGGASLGDPAVGLVLLKHGPSLDWPRLLSRLGGLEALLLAHVFLLWHRHGESGRAAIPGAVVETLLARVNATAAASVEQPIH